VQFYTKKKKRLEIPIVSLIDILVILLIFFIVTMTFKEELGEEGEGEGEGGKDPDVAHFEITLPTTSELPAAKKGPRRTVLSIDSQQTVRIGNSTVTIEEIPGIVDRLKKLNPEMKLELKADVSVAWGTIVVVLNRLYEAGFTADDVPVHILREEKAGP
jgi:biopolymer transport protein ExbD